MTLALPVLQYPKHERLLRRVARPVTAEEFGTDAIYLFGEKLGATLLTNHAMGLASTQVEEAPAGEPWRVFVMLVKEENAMILWNPVIELASHYELGLEGCLSFESVMETMSAPSVVRISFQDTEGNPYTETFRGLHARAAWHEVQHLDGKVILDRMGALQKGLFLKAVRKARDGAPKR